MKYSKRGLFLAAALAIAAGAQNFPAMADPDGENGTGVLDAAASSDLYLGVIEGLIGQGRDRAALAFLDRFTVSKMKSPRYLLLRGEALLGADDDRGAAAAFASLDGTVFAPEGLDGQGRAEAKAGHWDAARAYFRRAVAARPSSPAFVNNLGYAELRLGDHAGVAAFRQAYELAPQNNLIRDNLILALARAGDAGAADVLLKTIVPPRERAAVTRFVADWDEPTASPAADGQKETTP